MRKMLEYLVVAWLYLFGVFLIIHSTDSRGDETSVWVNTIGRSFHTDRSAHYNENNLGIGLEIKVDRSWKLVGGEYENSIRHHSNYVGVTWLPVPVSKHWRFGVTTIAVSGYTVDPAIVPIPTFVYENGHFGVNVLTVGSVSALMIKVGW